MVFKLFCSIAHIFTKKLFVVHHELLNFVKISQRLCGHTPFCKIRKYKTQGRISSNYNERVQNINVKGYIRRTTQPTPNTHAAR